MLPLELIQSRSKKEELKRCMVCGKEKHLAQILSICPDCLKTESSDEIQKLLTQKHAIVRNSLNLQPRVPRTEDGIQCQFCSVNCRLSEGQWGWCRLRKNENGRFKHLITRTEGLVYYYLDPHVTNGCNAWFCPAGTGCGYPKYAMRPHSERGYYNLALFCYGCSFNCLFCQNWEHKLIEKAPRITVDELINYTLRNSKITCWCWFGGSVEPQFPFVLAASSKIVNLTHGKRIMRICFEWNGDGNPKLVEKAATLVKMSGGNIKFDFKGWNPSIHLALTGRSNDTVKENIKLIYRKYWSDEKKYPPILGVTTLLVPYYVDADEVEQITSFLADLNPNIPYSLLIFHPDFYMSDLPITPLKQVKECYNSAKKHLNKVNIGNLHLLGLDSASVLEDS